MSDMAVVVVVVVVTGGRGSCFLKKRKDMNVRYLEGRVGGSRNSLLR